MIEMGVTPCPVRREDGTYEVTLGRISLPHLPLSKRTIAALKLSKHELVGHFELRGKILRPAFKLVSVTTHFEEKCQVVMGKIRSCGVGDNLMQYLRETSNGPLIFDMHVEDQPHEDYLHVREITTIKGVSLMDRRANLMV